MKRFMIFIGFWGLLCIGNQLFATDWPAFRGPNANGISPEVLANKNWNEHNPAVLWKVALNDDGYAGPAVANGKVFIIDHQGKNDIVRALDLHTGVEAWRYSYADTIVANNGFARTTPVIDNAKVYTLSRLGIVLCLNANTGALIWTRNIIADFAGHRPEWDLSVSPIIDHDKLILTPGGENTAVVALNKDTGATIWKGGGSEMPGYATPVLATIDNIRQYVIFTAKSLIGVNTETGEKLWSYPWKTNCGVNAVTPIIIGNDVFFTAAYDQGSALLDVSQQSNKLIWHKKEIASRFSNPIYADGYLYTTTVANHLTCVDAKTGEIKWRQPGFESGGIVGIDGMLIVGDGKTGTYVLIKMSPDGYKEYGHITPLGGQSWTAPIISDGKLIIRNTNTIACIDLR